MKTIYSGYSKKGGIYIITNLKNKKIYIGSAKEFKRRYRGHIQSLRRGKHHNKHLQASFNKYGEDVFLYEVVEVVEGGKKARTKIEQEYLDIWLDRWEQCYNFQKKSVQKQGKFKNPEVTKRKISKAKREFYQTEKGKELIQRLSDQKRDKTYEEIYGIIKAEKIKQKIRDNKLIEMNRPKVKENLRKMHTGKSFEERFGIEKAQEIKKKQSQKRKGKYLGKDSSGFKILENIQLVSPEGEIFTRIEGIKDFALAHNLSPNHFSELLSGKRKSHHNWKILSN